MSPLVSLVSAELKGVQDTKVLLYQATIGPHILTQHTSPAQAQPPLKTLDPCISCSHGGMTCILCCSSKFRYPHAWKTQMVTSPAKPGFGQKQDQSFQPFSRHPVLSIALRIHSCWKRATISQSSLICSSRLDQAISDLQRRLGNRLQVFLEWGEWRSRLLGGPRGVVA